jgi:hypothetical protein
MMLFVVSAQRVLIGEDVFEINRLFEMTRHHQNLLIGVGSGRSQLSVHDHRLAHVAKRACKNAWGERGEERTQRRRNFLRPDTA